MHSIFWLIVAGSAGTLARYWLSGAVYALLGRGFPYGTSLVNVLGCFLFGLVYVACEERMLMRGETRLILLVGFMGAFTTFSTYIFESAELMRDAQWLKLSLNLILQNVLGVAAILAGGAVARLL